MASSRQGAARIHVDAPPEAVWALLADVPLQRIRAAAEAAYWSARVGGEAAG